MTRPIRAAFAACLALSLASIAQAAGFTPNALFATDRAAGDVVQVSAAGAITATLTASGALTGARDLAFGPNGHLYVARLDRIVEIDAANAVVSSFGQTSGIAGISAIAFGPDGHLYVAAATQDLVYEFDPGNGSVVRTLGAGSGLDDPRGLAVSPSGALFVSSFTQDEILEFSPGGTVVRTIGNGSGLTEPGRMALGPLGVLYVVSTGSGRILGFDDVTVVATLGSQAALSSDVAISFGPDARLYVCDGSNGGLYCFDADLQLVDSWTLPGVAPSGLAFAPFRFDVSLAGTLDFVGQATTKPKETAVVSIFPGQSRTMLQLFGAGAPEQLATFGGAGSMTFEGFEVSEGTGAKFRSLHGIQVPNAVAQRGPASLALRLKGKVDANGRFVVKLVTGTLHRAGSGFVYYANVTTLAPAN